jgi:glucokinase
MDVTAELMQTTLLGIEIGGTKLQIVNGDDAGRIIERRRFEVDRKQGGAGIREQIRKALDELVPATRPVAIGVGFGGPVDWSAGRIYRSHQIEGWEDFPLRDWLQSLSGVPVAADNDANTATLGETLHGAGRGLNPVFYVTLGSGVGGGLVLDGRIYHGAKPGESEIGHVRLDRRGTTVESRCSGWAVDARIRELKKTQPQSLLARLTAGAPGGEARWLAPALAEGDPAARSLLGEIAEDLGFALSHVVHLFHPEAILLGGGLSLVGEPLRAGVEAALREFTMDAFAPGPQIRLAALGEDAVPVGALELGKGAVLSTQRGGGGT